MQLFFFFQFLIIKTLDTYPTPLTDSVFCAQVSAFPRTWSITVDPEAKEKYPSIEPEVHPWEDMDYK